MPAPIQSRQYDAKLHSVVEYALKDWNLHRSPKTPFLQATADLFRGRCARLRLLMTLPTSVSLVSKKLQRALDEAHLEILGALEKKNGLTNDEKTKIGDLLEMKLSKQAEDNEKRRLSGDPTWDQDVLKEHQEGLFPLRVIEAGNSKSALLALFMAQVTGSWTTIETLLADLWEDCLNNCPNPLAKLEGQPKRIKAGSGVAKQQNSKRESKVVDLDLLSEHSFDIKTKMGTILKPRFSFSRLEGVREAYSCAFSRDHNRIDRALGDKALDALNAVRNLTIHRDGRADAEYISRTKFLPSIPKCTEGQYVPLDGDIVVELLKPAFSAASSLLASVDEWMERERAKQVP